MVGIVAESIPGYGVKVDSIIGNQKIKSVITLLSIIIDTKIVDKIMDGFIVNSLVQNFKDFINSIADTSSEIIYKTCRGNGGI